MSEQSNHWSFWLPIERGEYGFSRYVWKCGRCNKWTNEPLPECPKCHSQMRGEIYLCDPDQAKECTKTSCFINGGACRHTTKIEWARSASRVGLDKYAEFDLTRQQRKKDWIG